MIIAVTAKGPDEESQMDKRFGRAPWFVLYDTDAESYRAVDNSRAKGEEQGAGISAGETVFKQDVDILITSHVGPKAFRVLKAGAIKVALCDEEVTVSKAVDLFINGSLELVDGPDVEGHWN